MKRAELIYKDRLQKCDGKFGKARIRMDDTNEEIALSFRELLTAIEKNRIIVYSEGKTPEETYLSLRRDYYNRKNLNKQHHKVRMSRDLCSNDIEKQRIINDIIDTRLSVITLNRELTRLSKTQPSIFEEVYSEYANEKQNISLYVSNTDVNKLTAKLNEVKNIWRHRKDKLEEIRQLLNKCKSYGNLVTKIESNRVQIEKSLGEINKYIKSLTKLVNSNEILHNSIPLTFRAKKQIEKHIGRYCNYIKTIRNIAEIKVLHDEYRENIFEIYRYMDILGERLNILIELLDKCSKISFRVHNITYDTLRKYNKAKMEFEEIKCIQK